MAGAAAASAAHTASSMQLACIQQRSAAPLAQPAAGPLRPRQQRSRRLVVSAAAAGTRRAQRPAAPASFVLSSGVVDYYELLGVDDIATAQEIKAAYRALAKVCHVDIAGDSPNNREMCILLNEAYEVLMDPQQRTAYNAELDLALADEDDGYTGELLSKWMGGTKMGKNSDPAETRGVFVDEVSCIGCKQCVWLAPATFRMEDEFGRSRVFAQWLNSEDDIEAAMQSCPVSCIHWVEKEDLPALEFVCRSNKVKRTNVAAMMSQQGMVDDVWAATAKYLKDRQRKEEERARAARYSAAQEAARKAAAAGIMNRQDDWFSTFAQKVGLSNLAADAAAAMETAVYGTSYSSDDEYAGYAKVGRRMRSRQRGQQYGARGEAGGKVPRDRALVPTGGAALKPWRRDVA